MKTQKQILVEQLFYISSRIDDKKKQWTSLDIVMKSIEDDINKLNFEQKQILYQIDSLN